MDDTQRPLYMEDEARWIAEVLAGDPEAFAPLVRRYAPMVRAMVLQRLGATGEVDDVAQAVFVKAYEKLSSFRGVSKFSTWLYRLTVNACWDVLRAGGRAGETALEDLTPRDRARVLTVSVDGGDAERDEARRAAVERGLTRLSVAQRELLILREIEGRSYDDIADILGIALGTVESRLFRARRALQVLVSKEQVQR